MHKYLLGIDEAGRGPLAGPVSVGVVCIPRGFNWDLIRGVDDSKKLSAVKREKIFIETQKLKKEGLLNYSVTLVSSKVIDTKGIVFAIKKAMETSLSKVHEGVPHSEIRVLLDGSLRAPGEYLYQETIIKGDGKEKVIGLASVMAKVTRDRYMDKIGKKESLAVYKFTQHKGYGTRLHREAILEHGLSIMHRKGFCSKLLKS